ncbi:MAG TPA: cobinamide phosphate guanylyltransferase [Campylobacterales bacterium]|nr:cobinamide phosphate guanylyltransferase [Campylobacterales bacterium]
MSKILYYGGQKSGKSQLSELKALELADSSKPYYIATYDNSYSDNEMIDRVSKHKIQREDKFITIEETQNLAKHIKNGKTYLIDCISMWILNSINKTEHELITDIEKLNKIDANIIFVLNNLNEGVIPIDKQSRKFIDLTGIIGQKLASICDEVYEVKLGLAQRLK